ATKQMVGPFIFFDQMGPNEFITERGIDVRPHPHIGLATLTYLFSGHIYHRDSIGSFVGIKPGDVNLMISGRGITHSERTPQGIQTPHKLFGLQCWIALSKVHEAMKPEFHNLKKEEVPSVVSKNMIANIILGSAYGKTSPLKNIFNGVFIEIKVKDNNIIELPMHIEESGIYLLSGKIEIKGRVINSGEMLVLTNKINLTVRTLENCHFILLGGDTMNERRYLWWNFVASDVNLIERAKENWINKKFLMPIDDAEEFIPLPK
ncbi:pirin family protein, partial [Alphaproteobacteria bacterium]|nr:pirin family protein [Alphaproteobacteria bacterium]